MATDFQTIIENFGEPLTVKRRAPGTYVNGKWIEGSESDVSIVGSVQPSTGAQLDWLPESQRTGELLTIYSTVEIFPSQSNPQRNSDVVIYNGERYLVITVRRWLPTQIYWESLIVRETKE